MPLTQFDPENYRQLLADKCARVAEGFAAFDPPPAEVFESPLQAYRMRAEFRLWHEGAGRMQAMR